MDACKLYIDRLIACETKLAATSTQSARDEECFPPPYRERPKKIERRIPTVSREGIHIIRYVNQWGDEITKDEYNKIMCVR